MLIAPGKVCELADLPGPLHRDRREYRCRRAVCWWPQRCGGEGQSQDGLMLVGLAAALLPLQQGGGQAPPLVLPSRGLQPGWWRWAAGPIPAVLMAAGIPRPLQHVRGGHGSILFVSLPRRSCQRFHYELVFRSYNYYILSVKSCPELTFCIHGFHPGINCFVFVPSLNCYPCHKIWPVVQFINITADCSSGTLGSHSLFVRK